MPLKVNIVANYLGQIWIASMGLIFIPLYVQLLGMEAYGVIGFFAMLQTWFSILDLGMTPTMNREMARYQSGTKSLEATRNLLRTLEICALVVGALAFILIWFGSRDLASVWLKAQSLNPKTIQQALAIIALIVGLRILEGIYRGALIGLESQVLLNALSCILASLKFALVIPWLYWNPTLNTFFGWQLLISILSVVLFAFFANRALPQSQSRTHFSWLELRSTWRFTGGMLGLSLMGLLLTQLDKLILSTYLSLSDLGTYSLAATVAGSLSMIVSPITQAYFPRLVRLQEGQSKPALAQTFHQGCQLITVLVAPLAMLMIFCSRELLFFWSQDAGLAGKVGWLVSLLAIGYLLNATVTLPTQTQIACDWTDLNFKMNLFALTILIPVLMFVVPRYGTLGAGLVWAGLNGYYLIAIGYLMFRRILVGERIRWLVGDIAIPILGVIGLGWLASLAGPYTNLPRPIGIATLAVLGIAATILAMCLANSIRPFVWQLWSRLAFKPS
jgi:O-antigen/teichoic acid export membrane protein